MYVARLKKFSLQKVCAQDRTTEVKTSMTFVTDFNLLLLNTTSICELTMFVVSLSFLQWLLLQLCTSACFSLAPLNSASPNLLE
jgi:hypothetical protein